MKSGVQEFKSTEVQTHVLWINLFCVTRNANVCTPVLLKILYS